MRIGLVDGHPALTTEVRDVLGRAHDLHSTSLRGALDQQEGDANLDLVVVVWSSDPLGRSDAARLVSGLSGERTLAVLPHDMTADRLGLVDAGIDYLTYPYDPIELLRRIELLGDGAGRMPQVLWLGETMLDEGSRRVERARHPIELTRKEFELLAHLMRNRGLVQERSTLLESVWGSTSYNENVIEVTVSSLRQKLEQHGPRIVQTVRGVGYVCRAEHLSETELQSLIDQRAELLVDRERLELRRSGLIERARTASALSRARSDDEHETATRLRATIVELETRNMDLRATNTDFESAHDELRATDGELQAIDDELDVRTRRSE